MNNDFSSVLEDLESIEDDNGKKLIRNLDSHIIDLIDKDRFTERDLKKFRSQINEESQLLTGYVEGYFYWRNQELVENPYQEGIQKALESLKKYIKASREFGWTYLEAFSIEQYLALKKEVGKITDSDIRKVESFLNSQVDINTKINTKKLLNNVKDNAKYIDDESVLIDIVSWCKTQGEKNNKSGNYWSERYYLWNARYILSKMDKDVESKIENIESDIIDSWDRELNEREKEGSLIISGLIRSAMGECINIIDERKKEEWLELRGRHNRSSPSEMTHLEYAYSIPLPKTVGDQAVIRGLINIDSQKALYSFAFSRTHKCPREISKLIPTPLQRAMGFELVTEIGGDIRTSASNYYYMMLLENQNSYFANLLQASMMSITASSSKGLGSSIFFLSL